MSAKNLIENHKKSKVVYHITPTSNLKIIQSVGLIPKLGKRSKKIESKPAIYFFNSLEDVQSAIENWLSDEFSENSRLALLQVILPQDIEIKSDVEYECHTYNAIPPRNIRIMSKDVFGEIDLSTLQ